MKGNIYSLLFWLFELALCAYIIRDIISKSLDWVYLIFLILLILLAITSVFGIISIICKIIKEKKE